VSEAPLPDIVLLAEREGVVFAAASHGLGRARRPRRMRPDAALVVVPATEDEVRAAELQPAADPDDWPQALPRPDLLAPALSRLLQGDHAEMTLQRGRDGVKGILVGTDGQKHPFPVAPRDALGLLAALFHCAPRGVVALPGPAAARLLLAVRPGPRPHEFLLRIAGTVGPAPRALPDLGLSPSLLEVVTDALDQHSGILAVAGGSASGRGTTLERMVQILLARGRRGGRIGARGPGALPWIAAALSDWPFPESLREVAPDFLLVDHLHGDREIALAGRLAACGALVLAGLPPGDPEWSARRLRRVFEEAAQPGLAVGVLSQGLVRTVCRGCRATTTIAPERALRLGFHRRDVEEMERHGGFVVPRGSGCAACAGTGADGLTGIFAWSGPDERDATLPSLQEEGWRRVVEGSARFEDVLALPAEGTRSMRSLREVAALAGAPRPPRASVPAEIPARAVPRAADGPGAEAVSAPVASATEDATRLDAVWRAAARGEERSQEVRDLARLLAGRTADAPLSPLLAVDGEAPEPARHAINTALIAARIAAALGSGEDAPATALLALLHDTGLDDRTVERLGGGGTEMRARLAEIRALLDPAAPSTERSRSDLRSQSVALAALAHRLHEGGRRRGLDLHDVTSLVMAQHGQRFAPLLFRALLRAVPIFPIGCLVELSSGDVARVVTQNEENHFRPRVEIASATGGTERRVVDLSRAPFLHIRHRVTAAESP
jgi:hypothetical protein